MSRPRQARSVETRARLLAAAAGIIAENGIEGASVDAIAERAERTSGSLYGQFGSKDGLIVELLDRSKDVVAHSMFVDIEAAATLDERLAAMWRNFADPPDAARDWVRFEHEVWVWANRPGNEAVRARLGERYRTEFGTLAAALEQWAGEGLIAPPGPIDRVATVVVSTLLGLEMAYRLDRAAVDERTVVTALRGILRACDADGEGDGEPAGARAGRGRRRGGGTRMGTGAARVTGPRDRDRDRARATVPDRSDREES
jgi:AcrR family transcriptional regulator